MTPINYTKRVDGPHEKVDPNGPLPILAVEQRVVRSLIILAFRQVLAYGSIFFGNLLLARWVQPEVYGVFAAALAFQAALAMFADAGLGPALIQRERAPTHEELSSLFTLQLILFGFVAVIIWFLAPPIARAGGFAVQGELIVRTLALIFGITALRSIPAIMLERELRFNMLALAEVVGTVVYQVTILVLVATGVGVASVIWALIARYICDLVIIWIAHPWSPSLTLRLQPIMGYIRYGVNMQGVRLLGYVKDQLPILLLVAFSGAAAAGLWGWALVYIGVPIYFNRLIDRVTFPAFARIQHDRERLGTLIGAALWMNFAVGVPVIFVLVAFADDVVPLLYSAKWLVAVPVAIWLAPNMLGGLATSTLMTALYSVGATGRALRIFTVWAVLTIAFAMPWLFLGNLSGMAGGFSAATLIVSVLLVFSVRAVADVNLYQAMIGPTVGVLIAIIVGVIGIWLHLLWFFVAMVALAVYAVTLLLLSRHYIRLLMHAFR